MKILIAEDELQIAKSLIKNFESDEHTVLWAKNGESALKLFNKEKVDVILLDWRMPKMSGMEVCKQIRKFDPVVPVILLTALNDIANKVEALNAGADDYITKPFLFDEVIARIHAVVRRSASQKTKLSFSNLSLDMINHELIKGSNKVRLPEMEFKLLCYLVENKNKIVNKEQLCTDVWELSFQPATNFIEATIKNLRKKLEEFSGQIFIKTVYGEGYIFVIE